MILAELFNLLFVELWLCSGALRSHRFNLSLDFLTPAILRFLWLSLLMLMMLRIKDKLLIQVHLQLVFDNKKLIISHGKKNNFPRKVLWVKYGYS